MGCQSSHLRAQQLVVEAERKREMNRRSLELSLTTLNCLHTENRQRLLFQWHYMMKCKILAHNRRQLCAQIEKHVKACRHAVHLSILSYEPTSTNHSAEIELLIGVPLQLPPGQFIVYDCRSLIRATLAAMPSELFELHDANLIIQPIEKCCNSEWNGLHLEHRGQFQLQSLTPELAAVEVQHLLQAFHSLLAWRLIWNSKENEIVVHFVFSLGLAPMQLQQQLNGVSIHQHNTAAQPRPIAVTSGKPSRSMRSHVSPRSFGVSQPTSSLEVHPSSLIQKQPDSPL